MRLNQLPVLIDTILEDRPEYDAMPATPARLNANLLHAQRMEITEHQIYSALSRRVKDPENRRVLEEIAAQEMEHYRSLQKLTGLEASPDMWRVRLYLLLSGIFGVTFAIKLMERSEGEAGKVYSRMEAPPPTIARLIMDEEQHEQELIALIDEERLKYTGSMVLGLNDALVELTGSLAGFTFALQDNRLIALAGLVTGISASLSMAASEYLSTRAEGGERIPFRAAIYTGTAYILTVVLLVAPFFLLPDYLRSLGITVCNAILIIAVFSFYLSVTKGVSFRRRFSEMVAVSMGVALVSFAAGVLIRQSLGLGV